MNQFMTNYKQNNKSVDSIYIKMFNTPEIIKDDKKILLPFRKAEALFYYMIVKKQATREEVVNLLWGDHEEEAAKKNLRNAVYNIKKTLDMDIIISPQKSILEVNTKILIKTDLEEFLQSEEDWLKAYSGDFLQGFSIKDGNDFESWIYREREYYKDLYISRLRKKIDEEFNKKTFSKVEYYGKLLIQTDIFDEVSYQTLMKAYSYHGDFDKSINLYNKLSDVLKKELEIEPDFETKNLLAEIFDMRDHAYSNNHENAKEYFYVRHMEFDTLIKNYESFIRNEQARSILIIGEAGIGKTKLKSRFLEYIKHGEQYIFEANCYNEEQLLVLKPWDTLCAKLNSIIRKENLEIPDFYREILSCFFPAFSAGEYDFNSNMLKDINILKFELVEKAIVYVFNMLSRKKKVILVFEDMQWMDEMSIVFLRNIMLQQYNDNIIFLGTCRNDQDKNLEKLITPAIRYDKINKIKLKRLGMDEVTDFVRKALPKKEFDDEILKRIYQESEGNPFFIMECINSLKENKEVLIDLSKVGDILKNYIMDISNDSKNIINIISMFANKAPLEIVHAMLGKDEFQMMNCIEELEIKGIIQEDNHLNIISFSFVHKKLKEFIYYQQTNAWRRLIHNQIGNAIVKYINRYPYNQLIYSEIIYQYQNGANEIEALNYLIKYTSMHFDLNHNIFPIINGVNVVSEDLYFSEEKTISYLNKIEKILTLVKKEWPYSEDVIKHELKYLHLKGRYLIFKGHYDEGIDYIYRLIENSKKINDAKYMIQGYLQIIYYSIQINDVDLMKEYIERALKIAREIKDSEEIAILTRLKGLNKILENDNDNGEKYLRKSIELFKKIGIFEEKYSANIAASYNYLGEIQRYNSDFIGALNFYNRAISICEKSNALCALALFYVNAGQALMGIGNFQDAKVHFEHSLSIYNQIDFVWGKGYAEGYLSIIYLDEKKPKEALKALEEAENSARRLRNPAELGFINKVKIEINIKLKEI